MRCSTPLSPPVRMSRGREVRIWAPGRRARRTATIFLSLFVILITLVGSISPVLPNIVAAFARSSSSTPSPACTPSLSNSTSTTICSGSSSLTSNPSSTITPNSATAGPVPDLTLPRTVTSSLGGLINAGGVVQASPQNLTLYNSDTALRLLGGALPHDELIGVGQRTLSSWSFWGIEVLDGGTWKPLSPKSSNFTILGTNTTGSYVTRTMQVSNGLYSGTFVITYKATSAGPLEWDLDFTPTTNGRFILAYQWQNITSTHRLLSTSRQLQVQYETTNYTFDWQDVRSSFKTTASILGTSFLFSIALGSVSAGSTARIDPSLVGSSPYSTATSGTYQRKVFYEPRSARYWAFYGADCIGMQSGLQYTSSTDGITWSSPTSTPGSGYCGWQPAGDTYDVYNSGTAVVIAWGTLGDSPNPTSNCFGMGYPFCINYVVGNITGSQITWGTWWSPVVGNFNHCDVFFDQQCKRGTRYVSATATSTGKLAFSFNAFANTTTSYSSCGYTGHPYTESDVEVAFFDSGSPNNVWTLSTVMSNSLCVNPGQSGVDVSDQDRSIVLPADSQGGVRVIYQSCSGCGGNPSLHSEWANFQGSTGSDETIAPSVMNTDEFSAVNDPTFGMHVAYRTTDGKVAYEYRSATGSLWSPPSLNLFGGVVNYPTISVDYSTNDLYIAGIATGSPTSSIVMKSKSLSQNWTDVSPVYPVMGRKNPAFLTSNAISASYTNASQILLLWTEGPGTSGSYNVTFAYVPIQTVWSPYAAPTDPWDNNGISPYGQYFANLGESVSPMTGMLTVVQTDLSIPGRGIDLSISHAYIEPYSFLNNQPYLYERYPWAPMGDGWQLNFPWMNNTNAPLYIHLWNGEAYRIPSSFWKGPIANFENHQGDNFRLVRNTDNTIVLYTASGGSYSFDSSHRLTSIIDTTANNTISFIYSNNLISCLTDTASRAYTFSYSSGLLSSVQQINGTCGSPGSTVRRILYGNNGQSLTSVTDPGNRVTSYAYQATSGTVAPWLLSRITFPTGSYSNYTYTAYAMGTTANSYRVTKQ